MSEHYTKKTIEAPAWCNRCNRTTRHRVSGGRLLHCLEHLVQERTRAQQKMRPTNQWDLFDAHKGPRRDPKELREKFPNLNTCWRPKANPKYIGDPWRDQLTGQELEWGEYMGNWTQNRAERECRRTTLGIPEHIDTPENRRTANVKGKRREVIVAKKLDLAFPPDWRERFSPRPDFGPLDGPGLCIRSSDYGDASIIVRPDELDNCVFILVHEFALGDGRLHACCLGGDAKKYTRLTNPPVRMNGVVTQVDRPAHFVKMTIDGKPNPIVHLFGDTPLPPELEKVLKLCPRGYKVWSVK